MGHADVSITMNIHAEVKQDVTRASIEKLSKIWICLEKNPH